MTRANFDAQFAAFETAYTTFAECDAAFQLKEGVLHAALNQNTRFISAALAQARAQFPKGTAERNLIDAIPTRPSTEAPGQAQITSAQSPGNGQVQLTFTAPHATSFQVWHKGPEEEEFENVAEALLPGQYSASGLGGGQHQYRIVPVNSRGEGAASDVITVAVVAAAPPEQAQITLAESPAPGQAHLTGEAVGATTIHLYHKAPGDEQFGILANVAAGTIYFVASGLASGEHQFKMRGLNAFGPGPESEIVTLDVAQAAAA
jgi:hypothetical protein